MEKNGTHKYTTFVKGQEVELSKEQHVMKRRFLQRDEYHQRKRQPKICSLDQAAEELIPIEYRKTQEMNTLEQDVLIRMEVERILELIRKRSEIDYEIIVDIFIHEMTEAEVAKKLGTSQQNIHQRKKRIIERIRKQEKE